MKKKLFLKESVKATLLTICLLTVLASATMIYKDRIQKINNGEMELVYQYGGDV